LRRACIDIGSNTTRLLVAELDGAGLVPLHEERVFTRLGAALGDHGTIPEDKRREVIEVVAAQLQSARSLEAQTVHGVATAAVRCAADGPEFARTLAEHTGLELTVLSDEEEARLAFCGAAGTFAGRPPDPLGVLDVGGGSCEVVVGRAPNRVDWWRSLPIGSGSLARAHLPGDPPTHTELQTARAVVAELVDALEPPAVAGLVAVGGSATSLGRMAGPTLDQDSLTRSLAALTAEPAAAAAARHGIAADRARLLPAGILILQALGARLAGTVTVGRGGVREGVLLEAERRRSGPPAER
jgi:exopolyphosphatase/guanosine-5'-triphosphate,3'-diphosphate pyrophosphatase